MGGFDASTAVEALDYDFTSVGGEKGTIAEPSPKQVEDALERIRKAATEGGIDLASLDDDSPGAILRVLADAPEGALTKITQEVSDAAVELCGGKPSKEEVDALPYRVQQAFVGWLLGQFSDPQRQNGASSS